VGRKFCLPIDVNLLGAPGAEMSKRGEMMIAETHPLRQFFLELVEHHYDEDIGLRSPEMHGYVANMLTEFCETERLYQIRNADGRPLHDVGEMMLESDVVYGQAPSFEREREVRKHIGDFTLFFTGMFPESINKWRLRRARLEGFIDFMKAGKESYRVVSMFDQFEYAKVAPLFHQLSEDFERCVYGLNMVKNDLQEMQHPIMRQAPEFLM
jgi:hypothetical protein